MSMMKALLLCYFAVMFVTSKDIIIQRILNVGKEGFQFDVGKNLQGVCQPDAANHRRGI